MPESGRVGRRMRWVAEAGLIAASVFLGIFLEGLADDASRVADTNRSLAQLASQLRADSADLVAVHEHQMRLGGHYDALLRWLGTPRTMPNDSVHAALLEIALLNKTMYPRKGAWEAITSTGRLAWVRDQDLVTRLGNLYGSSMDKLEYMGQDYDFNVNELSRVAIGRAWDAQRERLVSTDGAALVELRGQLWYLSESWNAYYLDLIAQYGAEVNELLPELEACLAESGS